MLLRNRGFREALKVSEAELTKRGFRNAAMRLPDAVTSTAVSEMAGWTVEKIHAKQPGASASPQPARRSVFRDCSNAAK